VLVITAAPADARPPHPHMPKVVRRHAHVLALAGILIRG